MPKNAVTDWSTTASLNTDVGGIDIDENCAARNINDAIREVMEQIAAAHTAYTWTLLDDANAGAARTTLGMSANGSSLVSAADYAAMRTLLDLEAGTDFYSVSGADAAFQAIDAQLASTIRQNSQSDAYTLVLTDGGKHIFHPAADTTPRIWTIPADASVAFPIGTAVTFINQHGAGAITIAITTDTMRLAGAGTTGSRTLAANGIATAVKITSAEWIISGTGLT